MSNEAPAAGDGRRSQRALIALLVTVAAVVIVALIAVLTRGGPAQYAEGSPEGVVQRYVQAVTDGDRQTALALLTPTIAEECQRLEPSGEDYRVTLTGAKECRKVRIDPSVLSDPEMAEDLVAAAFNDAVNKANAASQEKMGAATAGMPLPPGMKMPF